jgi:hypothetical protein
MGRHHTVSHTIQPYASDSQQILDRLQAAGLTQDVLLRDWGVMLWSVRVKENEVKFKLHPVGKVDEPALRMLFEVILGTGLSVTLKLKSLSKCCQSACEGCLSGNSEKRLEWVEPFL